MPWKAAALISLLLGTIIILGVLGGYIIYIFGYIGSSDIEGLLEYVAKRGKGDALLEVIDAVVTSVANLGVLYTALERL